MANCRNNRKFFFFFPTDGQGEWGMTEWDEEEERRRSVKFIDNVIPDTRAQLRVLSKSYQVGCEYTDTWNTDIFTLLN